jgi:hypothetical protein
MNADQLKPGQRVRITQTIERRAGDWNATVTGVIESVDTSTTGSWFAHGRDDKFWLRRIRLRKDDGEISTLNADLRTDVELLT